MASPPAVETGRTGPDVGVYLAPAEYVDSDHPTIVAAARRIVGTDGTDAVAAARKLFAWVRDVRYEADDFEDVENYRASRVLAAGRGYCVVKAGLLAALARASGIPARVAFADVRNHLASPRLLEAMGTDTFAWHGYTELLLGNRWLAVSPTFDRQLCERAGVPVLEFDGEHDALLQAFDGGGHLRYERLHGSFHDIPARFLAREMPRRYPFVAAGGLERFKRQGPR
jgi:transglutaminase-like putative cysteine protease